MRGIAVTAQGKRSQQMLAVDARVDGRRQSAFWIAFAKQPSTPGNGTDLWAIKDNLDLGHAAAHRHDRRAHHDAARAGDRVTGLTLR